MSKKTDHPGPGHNGGPPIDDMTIASVIKSLVPRIERLAEEKKAIQEDIKDCYLEAKSQGVNVKALREALKVRQQNREERNALMAELDRYLGIVEAI